MQSPNTWNQFNKNNETSDSIQNPTAEVNARSGDFSPTYPSENQQLHDFD